MRADQSRSSSWGEAAGPRRSSSQSAPHSNPRTTRFVVRPASQCSQAWKRLANMEASGSRGGERQRGMLLWSASPGGTMGLKDVDVRTAFELQSREGYTYVDVRSVPEYDGGHAQGAHNVPLLHRDPATGQMLPNPEFLAGDAGQLPAERPSSSIGCQMGGRSARAAQVLAAAGYEDVANVRGGYGGAPRPAQRPGAGRGLGSGRVAGGAVGAVRRRLRGPARQARLIGRLRPATFHSP